MLDSQIVAAVNAGDPAGLEAAYDTYAASLHACCAALLADPDEAATVLGDTFVVAAARLPELADPDLLAPWLFAVARNECHRRLRARDRADLGALGLDGDYYEDGYGYGHEGAGEYEDGDLRALVLAAIEDLNAADREVVELSLRGHLNGPGLAAALGVDTDEARARVGRARARLEETLGPAILAQTGRDACPQLDDLLYSDDGGPAQGRVSRHIERCAECAARLHREVSPAALASVLPDVPLPAGLRATVLRRALGVRRTAVRYQQQVLRRAGPFSESGFPFPAAIAGRGPGMRRRTSVVAAAAVVVLVAGGGTAAALTRSSKPEVSTAARDAVPAAPAVTASGAGAVGSDPAVLPASPGTTAPQPGTSSPSPRASSSSPPTTRSPRATASPHPTSSPRATQEPPAVTLPGSATGSEPPAPPSSPPPPAPGTLTPSATQVTLGTGSRGTLTGSFTLAASGGPVTYDVTATQPGLSASPSGGTLPTGDSDTITITLSGVSTGGGTVVVSVGVSGGQVTLSYQVERPGSGQQPGAGSGLEP